MSLIRKRLLFVDDERGIRETLALILLRNGFGVTLAATVEQVTKPTNADELVARLTEKLATTAREVINGR